MNTSDQTYGWNGYMNGYTVYYLHVSVIFSTIKIQKKQGDLRKCSIFIEVR